jgi:hypothetical protein
VRRLTRLLAAALATAAATSACEDLSYREIGAEINVLVRRGHDGALVETALPRLVGFGTRAIPQIETALHTSPERGRLHLVNALERIGSAETVPVLRHLAVYDISEEVRATAQAALAGWAARPDQRGRAAKRALQRIEQRRTSGETPRP